MSLAVNSKKLLHVFHYSHTSLTTTVVQWLLFLPKCWPVFFERSQLWHKGRCIISNISARLHVSQNESPDFWLALFKRPIPLRTNVKISNLISKTGPKLPRNSWRVCFWWLFFISVICQCFKNVLLWGWKGRCFLAFSSLYFYWEEQLFWGESRASAGKRLTHDVALIGMTGSASATGTPEPTVGTHTDDGRVMTDHREGKRRIRATRH